jgi:hypothetical protein
MISKLSSHLGPTSLFSGVSAPSLILYLDAGNTFSYTGTGSTWYDLTNLNNDISLSNVTYNATYSHLTKFKGSLQFSGSNSGGALISGTAIPIMDSHYTIESWFQANSYNTNGGIIGWGNYGNNNEVNALRQYGTGFKNYWWSSDLQAIPSATPSIEYWYHVAATYDGTNRTIYLNGQSIGSDIPGVSHSVPYFNNLTVGVTNASEFFNGRLGMIKVWNKNLNSSQILAAFNSNKSKYGYDFGSMTFNDTQNAYLINSSTDYAFGTNDFTIEAFFKATATASYSYAGIVSLRDNGTYSNGLDINLQYVGPETPLIEFSANGNFLTYTASNNKWYHVAISRTGGTSSFFVNGTLFTQVADQSSYANNDLVVGRYYTNLNDYYFNGVISNVRVINGTGLYTGTFSIPSVQLSGTVSNTKLLISSQEIDPTKDMTGLQPPTISNNIGWTSSLPAFYEFNYTDFSDTTGLSLVHIIGVTNSMIYLTDTTAGWAANVYRTDAVRFDRNFSFNWVFECGGGGNPGADGFCVQWTTTNNTYGLQGGNVGLISNTSTINAFLFQTFTNNRIVWFHNNGEQGNQGLLLSIAQNVYYWMDYNYSTSTLYISYATTNTKPVSPQHTFTGVTFDSGNYYIGFGAATGGSVENHILKSMNLTFQS